MSGKRSRHRAKSGSGTLARLGWTLLVILVVVGTVAAINPSGRTRIADGLTALGERIDGSGAPSPTAEGAPADPPSAAPVTTPPATTTAAAPRTTAPKPRVTQTTPKVRPLVTYTYSIRTKGTFSSDARFLAGLAHDTYVDPRGWSLGGKIEFRQVASGGDFTLWMSSSENVPTFGPPCDDTYSCRAGRNVIVNEARWRLGSPSGVLAGNLTEYRKMVINHETGHWLGLHHRSCPGKGQKAPLMQQQSIDLAGCVPNAWPTASEIEAVASTHLPQGG